MDRIRKPRHASKAFGLAYLFFNAFLFVIVLVLAVQTSFSYSIFSPGWFYLAIPILGILSGIWIRKSQFGLFKTTLITISFLSSAFILFQAFVLGPQMDKVKAEKFKKLHHESEIQIEKSPELLFQAIYSNNIGLVRTQLASGVDVNAVNETGETALHATQDHNIASYLIEMGADIHAQDNQGMTPLFNKDIAIAELLLDSGADINHQSRDGNTPLIYYTYSGYLDGIKLLINRGADVGICNTDNHNARDIAEHFHPGSAVHQYLIGLHINNCSSDSLLIPSVKEKSKEGPIDLLFPERKD
ncbi:MAG: hypothetical protein FHK82_14800 [Sedimenticola thiotaurini]|uniref:Uncharacterized protein n=1 Tax=Sedimenticola thiotaurini TaxID=1543721 RepID=A0A558CST3_9GAMM|nr:MAG: hypothetical protein FHK82_14800 [Sedimenticola thiotaurini]